MKGTAAFKIILILSFVEIGISAESYRVGVGQTVTINEHGVSKNVSNSSCSHDIMVPTRTPTEWTTFRNNKPACVTLSDSVACTATVLHGHSLPSGASGQIQTYSEACAYPKFTCGLGDHSYQCVGTAWTETSYTPAECVNDGVQCP